MEGCRKGRGILFVIQRIGAYRTAENRVLEEQDGIQAFFSNWTQT
jgi:hypothetical protein